MTRGITYSTSAYPIGDPAVAVVVRDLAEQVVEAPGAMETAFMDAAEELHRLARRGPLLDVRDRRAVLDHRTRGRRRHARQRVGHIAYASPNAVNIMRLAGVEGALTGSTASSCRAAASASAGARHARRDRSRSRGGRASARLPHHRAAGGALVLVEDVTEARRREPELKVKEATIREVHHRVKNNLQTIA